MTAKHWSVNNVFWREVAGRIGRGGGPDAARGPPVGQPCLRPTIKVVPLNLYQDLKLEN